jgi:hypothetical protein
MKTSVALFFLIPICAFAQGTMYVYDQQSSTDETPFPGDGGDMRQIAGPWGQSFTPSLSSIDFIRLKFADGNTSDAGGATVYLNLHADSLTGAVLGSTAAVTMPSNFAGTTTFLFPTSIALTPGTTHYFEPILVPGQGSWLINGGEYGYPGGSIFANGLPALGSDLWFREGVIVPEPSSVSLILLAGTLLYLRRGKVS